MKWYIVEKEYVNYLHSIDNKVENIEYGNRIKPFVGIVLAINNFKYYVPISSVKKKHYKMKNYLDLYKIENNDTILGVLNINNMIPIKEKCVKNLEYKEIDKYRKFESNIERSKYIRLLSTELKIINNQERDIVERATKVYNLVNKYPKSNLAIRSCKFKELEKKVEHYKEE